MRRRLLYGGLILLLVALVVLFVSRRHARRTYKFPSRIAPANTIQPTRVGFTAADAPAITDVGATVERISNIRDLHQRLLELLKDKPSRERIDAVFELGKRLGADNFDGALALNKQVPVEWMRSVMTSGIFFSRGRTLGQQALDVEGHDLHGVDVIFAKGGAIVGWTSADPVAAWTFVKETKDEGLTTLAFATWELQDLNAALASVNAMPPGQEDFLVWAKTDPERAVNFAMELEAELRPGVLERIAHGWASNWSENYRPDFMSYVNVAVSGNSGDFISKEVTLWWARYEPRAALDDAVSQEPNAQGGEHVRMALMFRAESDPTAAIQWWNTYSLQHEEGRELGKELIRELAEVSPERAARLLDSSPALSETADDTYVLSKWMEWDPRATFDWVAGKNVDHETMVEASRTAGVSLARWSVEDALDWARGLTDSSLQLEAMSGVALAEGYAGSGHSTEWIRELSPGTARDRCVFAYVRGVLENATGSTTPNQSLLNVDEPNLPELADAVQKSMLSNGDRQQLLGLIYGWQTLP